MSVLAHYVITFVRNKNSVSYLYSFVNLSFTKDFKVVLSCIFFYLVKRQLLEAFLLAYYVITFCGNKYSVSYFYLFVNLSCTKHFKVVLSCIFLSREKAAHNCPECHYFRQKSFHHF